MVKSGMIDFCLFACDYSKRKTGSLSTTDTCSKQPSRKQFLSVQNLLERVRSCSPIRIIIHERGSRASTRIQTNPFRSPPCQKLLVRLLISTYFENFRAHMAVLAPIVSARGVPRRAGCVSACDGGQNHYHDHDRTADHHDACPRAFYLCSRPASALVSYYGARKRLGWLAP